MRKTVIIFGGAGFIGSNWAHLLLTHTDCRIHIVDNLSRDGVRHNLEWLRKVGVDRVQVTIGDVRDAALVGRIVSDADEVYHFAAQVAVTTSVIDPAHDFDVNLRGTFNILEAVRKSERRPLLLFTSTNKVYGDLGHPSVVKEPKRYRLAEVAAISELQPLDFHSP